MIESPLPPSRYHAVPVHERRAQLTANGTIKKTRSSTAASIVRAARRASCILLIVIPLVAGLWLSDWMLAKRFLAVITPDSIGYIESARWFAAGQGISCGEPGQLVPMTHWAPLYPVTLGAATMLGTTAQRAALVINCWSLGISLLFLGLIVWRLSGSVAAGIAAQAVAALAWPFLRWHLYALSEPLFVALASGGVWGLVEYERRQRPVWLALGAVLLSLAVMCRYAGVGIAIGAMACFLWRSPRRVRDALLLGAATLMPLLLWVMLRRPDVRWGIGRNIGFEPPSADNLAGGFCVLGHFIAPGAEEVSACALGVVPVALLALGAAFRRTRLIGLTGGVVDVEAFSASRDTSGVSLMVEVKEGQQVRADISPFVAFAEIEQAWNMGWVDSIATFFPEEKIALRLDKNAPESAFFTRKQASYMLRDSFRYRATESFKFLEFKYGKSGKKPPLAKAQWSFRREPAGKIIVAKVQVTLRKEGERWLISGIRIQD